MIQKPHDIKDISDIKRVLTDWYNNIGLDDLRGTGVKTEAPTVDSLDLGRSLIAEESGVPVLYYKTLDGVLYKTTLTAV